MATTGRVESERAGRARVWAERVLARLYIESSVRWAVTDCGVRIGPRDTIGSKHCRPRRSGRVSVKHDASATGSVLATHRAGRATRTAERSDIVDGVGDGELVS